MNHRALLVIGVFTTSAWATAAELSTLRVIAPATLQHLGASTALLPARAIAAGDVVSVGSHGKVALQLAGSGAMTLSNLGDVQVFEAKAASGKLPASAKLKLLAGAMHIDSRARNGKPGQDIRLNVGSLKAQIFSADAWAANTAEGDTLCLIAGVVSVQTQGADERLDVEGSCLRREPDGQLSRFNAESDPVIVGAIAATRFEGVGAETIVAALEPHSAVEASKAAVIATAAASRNAPPASVADAHGTWTIVVLSLAKLEPVTARAQALVAQGLPATARTATVNGVSMYRVAVGSFASQAEARAYAAGILAKSGIKGWLLPL